jgi:hypothetical protein
MTAVGGLDSPNVLLLFSAGTDHIQAVMCAWQLQLEGARGSMVLAVWCC